MRFLTSFWLFCKRDGASQGDTFSHVFRDEVLKAIFSSVLPSLIDRLGDAKDQVRDQDQSLLLKIMEQAASPQVSRETQGPLDRSPGVVRVVAFLCASLLRHQDHKAQVDGCVLLQFVWDRMLGSFKHKNSRTREGLCLCLIATLNT